MGMADGRRRALRALAARARPPLGREHVRGGNTSRAPVLLLHGPAHVRPERRGGRAVDAGTAALAGPLHRGDRNVPARPALWRSERATPCGGSSGRCSASSSRRRQERGERRSWPINGYDGLLAWLMRGPYGFDALLTARTESSRSQRPSRPGKRSSVWRALPDVGQWAAATLLWTGAGLVALVAAASRHREARQSPDLRWNYIFGTLEELRQRRACAEQHHADDPTAGCSGCSARTAPASPP